MKEYSTFSQWSMSVEQAQRIYDNYNIAFVCLGDKNEYYIEMETKKPNAGTLD